LATLSVSSKKKPGVRGAARSRAQIEVAINRAAIEVFAAEGFNGATTSAIAKKAGLTKASLHYHIDSKESLYRQILQDIVDDWIMVFGFLDEASGPRKVLADYIRRKMEFSFEHPLRSRIYTSEIMRGAPVLRTLLRTSSRRTEQATTVIRSWISKGQMVDIDPLVLMFSIWATTQFYADHLLQVQHFTGDDLRSADRREWLVDQVTTQLLRSVGAL
jgi:TetR/AcrR family transcriptional regulator